MKLALGLDVQTNAKVGKFMSIENSHQGALVCKVDVEVLWEPGNFQDDGAKRVGTCFATNTDLELWTEEVEQGVIDNMIIFQKPFPGTARTELESQLQRAVKVSAKGKHVKCKTRPSHAVTYASCQGSPSTTASAWTWSRAAPPVRGRVEGDELRFTGGGLAERAARGLQHKVAHLEEHAPLPAHQPHVPGLHKRTAATRELRGARLPAGCQKRQRRAR